MLRSKAVRNSLFTTKYVIEYTQMTQNLPTNQKHRAINVNQSVAIGDARILTGTIKIHIKYKQQLKKKDNYRNFNTQQKLIAYN